MTSSVLGSISLTISTILYSFWLMPQIVHNKRHNALGNMSFLMHAILVFGCLMDLYYALSLRMPLPYLWVSALSLTLIIVQHIQWYKQPLGENTYPTFWLLTGIATVLLPLALVNWYYDLTPDSLNVTTGWLANLSFLFYPIPQILKQSRAQCATSISLYFIYLGLVLDLTDLISAIALSWEKPSLFGPLALIGCHCILLVQHYRYQPKKEIIYEKSTHYC